MTMTNKDKARLRALAGQTCEIAHGEKMAETVRLWKAHNACRGERPMIRIELDTFADEIIPPLQQCEGEGARKLEWKLLHQIVNPTMFGDDSIVSGFFPVRTAAYFTAFGIDVKVEHADKSLGHSFVPVISDLEEDFGKIGKSAFGIDKERTKAEFDFASDAIGDILPVKMTGGTLSASLTQDIVHIMSMENIYIAMMECPELFGKMIMGLADDYVEFFSYLSREGALLPTAGGEMVGQGTYCYTDELPGEAPAEGVLKPGDLWGYADSQETVGVSGSTYRELVFPAYKKVVSSYGLLSYGCCEPVHSIWDDCLSTLPNLRKVSISAWCDESFMGERLAGTKVIYHRKPAANYLGLGTALDESATRKHIRKTLDSAKGCTVEFTQRDVYTVNSSPEKVKRFVEIIHEEIMR